MVEWVAPEATEAQAGLETVKKSFQRNKGPRHSFSLKLFLTFCKPACASFASEAACFSIRSISMS